MEITLLLKSIMGLVIILALLIFLLFLPSNQKKEKEKNAPKNITPTQQRPPNTDLEYLRSIIKKKKSTTQELKEALEMVIRYHGIVHEKLGLRTHPDFDIYMDILFTICRHPNTNKDIVVKFDRELARLNPDYKQEINEAITKGLNSRRV
ncbi:hypothetical protein SMGD1_1304 [Sulfurimonas gotlandica GD1]|uniref:Uncharacterized protein n=1 Tax=Sulfurimonas gotlandica (strain DSM 19862 / JCM 16533 / GD1) TaxID=929558 RepID=B6BH39_SULGG|nr:hypothetical protein [Sulfurimonas gotlandica]EDZ63347.1 conserved hypothetical protein [Sulfurimonas gotlandica GD1]EHP29828.1 hypothetical protein SMGD1_1304 [Sulfurimonas gotlandica GD1]